MNSRQEKKMIRLSSVTFKGEKITDWLAYFQYNEKHLLKLDFALSEKISKEEIRMIAPSVQAFQKGEGSDGRHLMKTVEDYANKTGDIRYVKEPTFRHIEKIYGCISDQASRYLRTGRDFSYAEEIQWTEGGDYGAGNSGNDRPVLLHSIIQGRIQRTSGTDLPTDAAG